jgi:hypothetical protein
MPVMKLPRPVSLDKEGTRRRLHNKEHMNNRTTYSLLIRSEEKSRDMLETAVYAMCILSAVFAIWQFAREPVALPGQLTSHQHVAPRVAGCCV